MMNMQEKLNDNLSALKDHAKLAVRELLSIRGTIADWCSEALTASIERDEELKQILVDQANAVFAPQSFEDFDEAYSVMNHLCQEFTENISEFWLEFDAMTLGKLVGVPPVCPHCRKNIDDTDEFCPHCGQHLGARIQYEEPKAVSVKKCSCGRTHNREDKYCPACGLEDIN